ncbi:MAG: ion channel [Xanthobacteraceae bacterium]
MKATKKRTRSGAQSRTHVIRVGRREIETRGLADGFWTDLYHRALTVYWPVFFASAAAIFIVLNAVFAFVYWLGNAPIANVSSTIPLPLNYFYFSIETLATVGYGDMHPQTDYGHLVATVEIFTGMTFLAVMTGLIFARFSRPRARFIFASHPIVGRHFGKKTLMIRVANERHNTISQATARLWLLRVEEDDRGAPLRRFHELKLERSEHPMFALSWTIFHPIDKASPLHGLTATDLAQTDGALVLNVSGVDDNSAQHLHARRLYTHTDIRWNHQYRDITSHSDEGRLLIDYDLFHEVTPEEA